MTSKSSISFERFFILPCEMQHTYTLFFSVGFCLERLNETSYKAWKRMDQQRSALAKHNQMFQLSATVPNLYPRPKSSLINRLINDRHSDVASTHQYLAHNFNRPAPVALPRFWAFGVVASRVWNSLPPVVTSASSLPSFKRQLKTFLFKNSFP